MFRTKIKLKKKEEAFAAFPLRNATRVTLPVLFVCLALLCTSVSAFPTLAFSSDTPASSGSCNSSVDAYGGFLLYTFGIFFLLVGLIALCEGALKDSLLELIRVFKIPEDVAGAVFMAAGTSSPELFTSLIASFGSEADIGTGTVVGSTMFNMLITIGSIPIFARGARFSLDWKVFSRDAIYSLISFAYLLGVLIDKQIHWYEAVIGLLLYLSYAVLMVFNSKLMLKLNNFSASPFGRKIERVLYKIQYHFMDKRDRIESEPVDQEGEYDEEEHGESGHEDGDDIEKGENNKNNKRKSQSIFDPDQEMSRESMELGSHNPIRSLISRDDLDHDNDDGQEDEINSRMDARSPARSNIRGRSRSRSRSKSQSRPRSKSRSAFRLSTLEHEVDPDEVDQNLLENPEQESALASSESNPDSESSSTSSSSSSSSTVRDPTLPESPPSVDPFARSRSRSSSPSSPRASPSSSPHSSLKSFRRKNSTALIDIVDEIVEGDHIAIEMSEIADRPSVDMERAYIEATEGDEPDADDDIEEDGHFNPFKATPLGWLWYILCSPYLFIFHFTIPPLKGRFKYFFLLRFTVSMIWLAAFTIPLVHWVETVGCILGLTDAIMGFTFLAICTTLSDWLSSIFVARSGFGEMAVSNALGSIIFDIQIILGSSWTLSTIINQGSITLDSSSIVKQTGILFLTMMAVFMALFLRGWKLDNRMGYLLFLLYGLFISYSILSELSIIPF